MTAYKRLLVLLFVTTLSDETSLEIEIRILTHPFGSNRTSLTHKFILP